tara:strand:- start:46 stop:354 length:309 start_codon:yes stop_codon:yes gene_type:complete
MGIICIPKHRQIICVYDIYEISLALSTTEEKTLFSELTGLILGYKTKMTVSEEIEEYIVYEWCCENIKHSCRIALRTGLICCHIIGEFEDELDAVAFKLRWA